MSKAKKLLTIASVTTFLFIIAKNAHKLFPNPNTPAVEIPDAMGYTADMRAKALLAQYEKLEKSKAEFEEGYYDEIPNRCRIQQEFFLTYILKCKNLYNFPPNPPVVLHHLISRCKKYNLIPLNIAKNLDSAKKYCNSGSHYNEALADSNSILFVINTTAELLEIWETTCIEK